MEASSRNATLARSYLTWLSTIRGRRPSTTYNYAATLDAFLSHVGERCVTQLTLQDLEAFMLRPRVRQSKNGRAAAGTLAREATTLRSFYAFLHQRGHTSRNPALFLAAPSRPRREPRPIADDLWRRVWTHAELTEEARVVLGLGFFLGLRRMEIVGLRPEQVAPRELVAFTRKGGGEDSLPSGVMLDVFAAEMPALFGHCGPAAFTEPLQALCEDARREGRPILLPWAEEIAQLASKRPRRVHELPAGDLDPQVLNKRLRRWLADVGLPNAFTPHQLRYSCATNLARCGMPVQLIQRLLNHADISTTQRYVRTSNIEVSDWFEQRQALRREHGPFV